MFHIASSPFNFSLLLLSTLFNIWLAVSTFTFAFLQLSLLSLSSLLVAAEAAHFSRLANQGKGVAVVVTGALCHAGNTPHPSHEGRQASLRHNYSIPHRWNISSRTVWWWSAIEVDRRMDIHIWRSWKSRILYPKNSRARILLEGTHTDLDVNSYIYILHSWKKKKTNKTKQKKKKKEKKKVRKKKRYTYIQTSKYLYSVYLLLTCIKVVIGNVYLQTHFEVSVRAHYRRWVRAYIYMKGHVEVIKKQRLIIDPAHPVTVFIFLCSVCLKVTAWFNHLYH